MSNQPTATVQAERLEFLIAPGVVFPNWSVVASDTVEQALTDIFQAFGVERCWRDLNLNENKVRRTIMDVYGHTGHAPTLEQLSDMTGLAPDDVTGLLSDLQRRDIVVLDKAGETITGAYPFTERDTEHRVVFGEVELNAMCAIDALGAGAMYGRDTNINSSCRHCSASIHVRTGDAGSTIEAYSPETAVVWSGIQFTEGCSADTMCTVMAFFCSDDHLQTWRTDNAEGIDGYRLTMDEGFQAGKAIFMPLLAVRR